jgi:hypothetical protein
MYLLGRDGPGEVRNNPPEQFVVGGEADKKLKLVVLAQARARSLDPSDQLRVHPGNRKSVLFLAKLIPQKEEMSRQSCFGNKNHCLLRLNYLLN